LQPESDKILLSKLFVKQVLADCYIEVECRAQCDILHNAHQLSTILQSDRPLETITSHNKIEATTHTQEGDTTMLLFDCMTTLASKPYNDPLGRWCWTTFEENNSITRLMVAYKPCKSAPERFYTVYAQQ